MVLAEGEEATEAELIAWCKDKAAGYKAPTSVEFRDELARTATGKLQKFKLRAAVLGGPRPPGQLSRPDRMRAVSSTAHGGLTAARQCLSHEHPRSTTRGHTMKKIVSTALMAMIGLVAVGLLSLQTAGTTQANDEVSKRDDDTPELVAGRRRR